MKHATARLFLMAVLACPFPLQAQLIFDSGAPSTSAFGAPSDVGAVTNQYSVADQFVLSGVTTTVTRIQWWGVYGSNLAYGDDFSIFFIPDDSGVPAQNSSTMAIFTGVVSRTDSGLNSGNGNDIYSYSVDITPQEIPSNQAYWVNIVNHSPDVSHSWGWIETGSNGVGRQALGPLFIWADSIERFATFAFKVTYTSPVMFLDNFEQ